MPKAEVFVPRQRKERKGVDVATIMGHKETKGEVGIEIEVEGKNIPSASITPSPWKYVIDHSLRGECAEFVLKSPVAFNKVPDALLALWETFRANKTKIADSNRTSVHVHLNCQKWFLNRLAAFCALYFIVEEPLTEWCGEYRVGNLFCLRAKDAPAIIHNLKKFIIYDGESRIGEFMHYSALNANALSKYGSLEIRTLRGCSDPSVIIDWVEMLERLYKLSADYEDPRDVCTSLSSVGPLAFFENILGPKASVIRQGINMTDSELAESVYEGVRLAQELCYCRDWSLYKPMKLKPDVFGRSLSKVAKKLMSASNPGAAMGQAYAAGAAGVYLEATAPSPYPSWMNTTSTNPYDVQPVPGFAEEFPQEPDFTLEADYDDED